VFGATFADSTSTELRKKLSEFLIDFETRHAKTLPKWLGDLDKFAGEEALVDEKFSGS
jgi:rubrerythrin